MCQSGNCKKRTTRVKLQHTLDTLFCERSITHSLSHLIPADERTRLSILSFRPSFTRTDFSNFADSPLLSSLGLRPGFANAILFFVSISDLRNVKPCVRDLRDDRTKRSVSRCRVALFDCQNQSQKSRRGTSGTKTGRNRGPGVAVVFVAMTS